MGAEPSRPPRGAGCLPAPTIRLRLALLYGAVFLITGAVLLTIGYLLVRNGLRSHHSLPTTLRRLGRSRRRRTACSAGLWAPRRVAGGQARARGPAPAASAARCTGCCSSTSGRCWP